MSALATQTGAAAGPRVSVVVPCYNAAAFLAQTVASVRGQSYASWELILVDDGSTDGRTPAMLQELALTDARIRVVAQANAGVSAARNRGLGLASGAYIALLDADDVWHPHNLALKVELLEAQPQAVAAYSDYETFDSQGGQRLELRADAGPATLRHRLLAQRQPHSLAPSNVVVRAAALQAAGGFDVRLSTSADWELWLRLLALGPFAHAPQPLMRYRVHPGQMSRNIALMERDMRLAVAKHLPLGTLGQGATRRRYHASILMSIGLSYAAHTPQKMRALWLLAQSVALHPGPALGYGAQWLARRLGRLGSSRPS